MYIAEHAAEIFSPTSSTKLAEEPKRIALETCLVSPLTEDNISGVINSLELKIERSKFNMETKPKSSWLILTLLSGLPIFWKADPS